MGQSKKKRIALVLSGGGARGAYQAGAMKAIGEICAEVNNPEAFPIITGVSAGAINAVFLAARKDSFASACTRLMELWMAIRINQVIRTDIKSLSRIGFKLASDIISSGSVGRERANCLLDMSPLFDLLNRHVDFDQITMNQQSGIMDTLTVSATDYASSENVTFVHSNYDYQPWRRLRRMSQTAEINVNHICASAAIPLFFAPVSMDNRHFGDGCLRNTAPLSPAVHLDADALIVIGVQHSPITLELPPIADADLETPSIARILSVLLNSVMLDGIGSDVERLSRINNTLRRVPEAERPQTGLRIVDYMHMSPSADISEIANQEYGTLPRSLRYLVEGLGSRDEVSNLSSYLLFVSSYCTRLAEMGYADARKRQEEIASIVSP